MESEPAKEDASQAQTAAHGTASSSQENSSSPSRRSEEKLGNADKWINETQTRVPPTDWYMTTDGKQYGFQGRNAVGGLFIKEHRFETTLRRRPQSFVPWL